MNKKLFFSAYCFFPLQKKKHILGFVLLLVFAFICVCMCECLKFSQFYLRKKQEKLQKDLEEAAREPDTVDTSRLYFLIYKYGIYAFILKFLYGIVFNDSYIFCQLF